MLSAIVVPESLRTKLPFPYARAGWWLELTAAVTDRTMVTTVTAGQPVGVARHTCTAGHAAQLPQPVRGIQSCTLL